MTKRCGLLELIAVLTWAIFPGCTNPFELSVKIDKVLAQNDITETVCARQRMYMVSRINSGEKLPLLYDLRLGRPIRVLRTRFSMKYLLGSIHDVGSIVLGDCITSRSVGPGRVSRLNSAKVSRFGELTILTVPKASFTPSSTSSFSIADWDVTCRPISVALLVRRCLPSMDLQEAVFDRCFFLAGSSFSDRVGMAM